MAQYPSLPLFTDAYIADTQHLTNEEHGVYLRLLMFAWRTAECGLPDDDRRLALMVGVTPKKWATLKPVVMGFWTLREGLWTQKRLTAGREFVERSREQKRAAGFASSNAKALKKNNTIPTAVVTEVPTERVTEVPTERQQSISISIKDNNSRKTSSRDGAENGLSEANIREPKKDLIATEFEEKFWPVYPRKVDRKDALAAFRKARMKVPLDTIVTAVTAFAIEARGKDPQYVKHAARWINACSWENVAGAVAIETSEKWAARLQSARRQRRWSTRELGPLPGMTGCRVPVHLLEPGDGDGWTEMERGA
ncbi:DUF1376 domain-containing protein [Rhizobium calliandrae]|uniref:DUF1376 domain-containing protein n=1 Tax=Rhizobium calliandrae TaxID=1312182 RepID=A0ABT7KKQ2_9HYPH|nr:DUF1376 domain-containing protein [Rhizobium calliandrae]MDL2408737.1 DUF1376 domain-containing protein [Rhizobium calliandrae]